MKSLPHRLTGGVELVQENTMTEYLVLMKTPPRRQTITADSVDHTPETITFYKQSNEPNGKRLTRQVVAIFPVADLKSVVSK